MTREVIFNIQGWRRTAYILEEEYKRKVELFFRKVENGMAVFEWNGGLEMGDTFRESGEKFDILCPFCFTHNNWNGLKRLHCIACKRLLQARPIIPQKEEAGKGSVAHG